LDLRKPPRVQEKGSTFFHRTPGTREGGREEEFPGQRVSIRVVNPLCEIDEAQKRGTYGPQTRRRSTVKTGGGRLGPRYKGIIGKSNTKGLNEGRRN